MSAGDVIASVLPNKTQFDTMNLMLGKIASGIDKLGGKIEKYKDIQTLLRSGLIDYVLDVGDQIQVNKTTSATATPSGGGITSAMVEEQTFVDKVGTVDPGDYVFEYQNGNWIFLNGGVVEPIVNLAEYGISTSGTPQNGSKVTVTATGQKLIFDVVATDGYDTPVDTSKTHALSLLLHDCATYGSLSFKRQQALFYVDQAVYPSGLSAGIYTITLDHGAYGGGTGQDGTFQFTTTQTVPAGGLIRHSTMGMYQSGGYNKSQITAGTFTTYAADRTTIIENSIQTTVGMGGTSLGTTSGNNPTYKTNSNLNYTERNAYGSNRFADSDMREWMNGKAGWWSAKTKWDIKNTQITNGFLYGVDKDFIDVIGKVKKRTALSISDGYGYEDTEELVFLPSMTELNYGQNNNVYETSFGREGTIRTTPYPMYVGAQNADRIKYYSGSARYWFFRSPHPSYGYYVRSALTSGALGNNSANFAYGCVPGLCII